MRLRTPAVIALLFGCLGLAAGVPTVGGGAPVTVGNASFEALDGAEAADWRFVGGKLMKAVRGAGHNGSGGLVWESAGPATVQVGAVQELAVERGECYRFGALVRTEGFSATRGGVCICIEWCDARGKWIAGAYSPSFRDANADWCRIEGSTRAIPPEAARVTLQLYVTKGASGRVFFDNVTVSPLSRPPVCSVFSSAYRNVAASGLVRFHAVFAPRREWTPADISATFAYRNVAGRLCRVKPTCLDLNGATLELDVSDLERCRQRIVCTLTDAAGRTLGEAACDFTRVDILPSRRVWIDGYNRCIVDGKPFFPLGMYSHTVTEEWISDYAKGPFNCVMPYGRATREGLDLCRAHGLFCCADFHGALPGTSWARARKMTTREEVLGHCRCEIAALKSHPALLAWYVNDEASVMLVPDLCAKYELFCREDDQHPIWAVMDRVYDLRDFIPTFDVLGLDPYPVTQKPLASVTEMVRGAQACTRSDRPLWNVPQTFDWSWYRKDQAAKERFPTEREIRSMLWQHIAGGANGLVGYSFHCLRRDTTPVEFEDYWGRICRPYAEVRNLVPVLLSVDPAPVAAVMPDDLPLRVWRKDGDLHILVCNVRNEPLRAMVGIASGRWRAVAAEVGPMQTMAAPDTLSVDLDASGVSLMRLKPVVPRKVWPRGRTARPIGASVD